MMNIAFNPTPQGKQQVRFGSTVNIAKLAKHIKNEKTLKKIEKALRPLLNDGKDAHIQFEESYALTLLYKKHTKKLYLAHYSFPVLSFNSVFEIKSLIKKTIKKIQEIDIEAAGLARIPENLKT
ncbi:MAG: hypothetical protein WCG23_10385 [bacterium]